MTFSGPVINQSACGIYLSHIIIVISDQKQLTMAKTMADVHLTRMHCSRKSFEKANGRLLKDRHKAEG